MNAIGRSLPRIEDRPLLLGAGAFAADGRAPDQLHMRVVRSPVAFGRIRGIETAEVSLRVAKEQRDLAAQNDQMTQTAYTAGQGTSLELVVASEAHRQAELNLALADFNVVKARILAVLALATCPW